MTGQLITSFFESGDQGHSRWLEIWLFGDGSLNLVISSESGTASQEFAFPCAPHHLRGVLSGMSYQASNSSGLMNLRLDGAFVVAQFDRPDEIGGWTQQIPLDEIATGIEEVERVASRYVA